MTKHLIGVYGTLRKGFGNHGLFHREDTTEFVGKGKSIEPLVLQQQGIPYVSKKKVGQPGFKGSNVVIEVYAVTPSTLSRLDSLEGHPNWYFRHPVPVLLENGETVVPEVYLNEGSSAPENPTGDFANRDW